MSAEPPERSPEPKPPPLPPPPPAPWSSPPAVQPLGEFLQQWWPAWLLVVAIVGWFGGLEFLYRPYRSVESRPLSVLLLYGSMIAIGVSFTELVRRQNPSWTWTRLVGRTVTAAVVLTWGYYDHYERPWHRENISYTDTYHRWSERLYYRKMRVYKTTEDADKGSFLDDEFSEEGPMAGTGKPHGEWKWTLGLNHWADARKNHQPIGKTEFYWYGDEISEGEWHLGNRR